MRTLWAIAAPIAIPLIVLYIIVEWYLNRYRK